MYPASFTLDLANLEFPGFVNSPLLSTLFEAAEGPAVDAADDDDDDAWNILPCLLSLFMAALEKGFGLRGEDSGLLLPLALLRIWPSSSSLEESSFVGDLDEGLVARRGTTSAPFSSRGMAFTPSSGMMVSGLELILHSIEFGFCFDFLAAFSSFLFSLLLF